MFKIRNILQLKNSIVLYQRKTSILINRSYNRCSISPPPPPQQQQQQQQQPQSSININDFKINNDDYNQKHDNDTFGKSAKRLIGKGLISFYLLAITGVIATVELFDFIDLRKYPDFPSRVEGCDFRIIKYMSSGDYQYLCNYFERYPSHCIMLYDKIKYSPNAMYHLSLTQFHEFCMDYLSRPNHYKPLDPKYNRNKSLCLEYILNYKQYKKQLPNIEDLSTIIESKDNVMMEKLSFQPNNTTWGVIKENYKIPLLYGIATLLYSSVRVFSPNSTFRSNKPLVLISTSLFATLWPLKTQIYKTTSYPTSRMLGTNSNESNFTNSWVLSSKYSLLMIGLLLLQRKFYWFAPVFGIGITRSFFNEENRKKINVE